MIIFQPIKVLVLYYFWHFANLIFYDTLKCWITTAFQSLTWGLIEVLNALMSDMNDDDDGDDDDDDDDINV